MVWMMLFPVIIAAVIVWWVADDYIQRPMSYWSRAQLDAAFKRHPEELTKYVNRGKMSRKEWINAVKKRQAEVDAELARRGLKQ